MILVCESYIIHYLKSATTISLHDRFKYHLLPSTDSQDINCNL